MSAVSVPSASLVVLGSGIHDYPDHRKRIISDCFLAGLAPVVVPPRLIPHPEAISYFENLLAASRGYLGFFAHCYRPRSRLHEDASIYEKEWQLAVEQNRPRRIFAADLALHPLDAALLSADPTGFPRVFDLAARLQAEELGLRRFPSLAAFSDQLPGWLAELRADLGLQPDFRYRPLKSNRSEVFVSYAHKDDQDDRKWLRLLMPSLNALANPPTEIPFWYDDHLDSGEKWEQQIYDRIDRARVAVLLVSRHFFASRFISRNELPRILKAAEQQELKILPVLLEECLHDHLDERQFVGPRRNHALVPVESLSDSERNEFWKELERTIRTAFQATAPTDKDTTFPAPISEALVHMCEQDPKTCQRGLQRVVEFFCADVGRTPPWALPYLSWAKTQLALFARDPNKEIGAFAGSVLQNLPARLPSRVTQGRAAPTTTADDIEVRQVYLDWVERTHKWLELPGIKEIATLPRIELDRVFVALRGDRSTAHERMQSRRLLDLEVIQYAQSLNQDPTAIDLPDLRRQLLLIDEFMPIHRQVIRQSTAEEPTEKSVTLGEAFRRDRWLVILGEPGSGKTTLIRWLALQLAAAIQSGDGKVTVKRGQVDPSAPNDESGMYLGPARLPVLLRVADYADEKARRGLHYALHDYLGHHPWQGQHFPQTVLPANRLNELILDQLRAGQAVIMLDGMDEIVQAEMRDAIRADINRFIEQWINGRGDPQWVGRPDAYLIDGEPCESGGNQIVITSRIVGYQVAPLQGPLTHVLIEPMSELAVRTFCASWTHAVSEAARPNDPPEQRAAEAAAEAVGLETAIFDLNRPRIRELASNPLLITILALLYRRNNKRLPDQRVELYRTAINVLLDDWPDGPIDRDELRAVLPDVAELIHRTTSTGLIQPGNLKQVLAESLTRTRRAVGHMRPDQFVRADSEDIQDFLDVALRRVGIMAGRGDLLLGFVHLTFQEYLAALWLVRDQDVIATVTRIGGLLDNPRWREPILLALGHAGSQDGWPDHQFTRLLRALIEADATLGNVLPRIVLMLARALEELPRVPDDLVGEMTDQLLRALTAQSTLGGVVALRDEIDDALTRLRRQRAGVINDILVRALGNSQSAPTAAALIRRREWFELPFAEPLHSALIRGLDSKSLGWPVLMALRDYATPPLPPATPESPKPPKPPKVFDRWIELQKQRESVSCGNYLREITDEIDSLIKTLPEAVATDPAASDPTNSKSPVRQLQQLHEIRTRLESGEELQSLDEQINSLRPQYEQAVEFHAHAEREFDAELLKYQEAVAEHQSARQTECPQWHWPIGLFPLKQWLRDEPRREEELLRGPAWMTVIVALYGGVKDYRVERYKLAYEKAVEGFHEFSYTYEDRQDDAIYERAVALENFKPSPDRWRANLSFAFSPDFVFRHSPLHGELVARFDVGDTPSGDCWLEHLWTHDVPAVAIEAALALFAAGENVEPLLAATWATSDSVMRERAASTLNALEGLLAGWRETLEHLLPKVLSKMLTLIGDLPSPEADNLRELLLANVRNIADPKARAIALWNLLPQVPDHLIGEVWEEALGATWATANHLGYDDPIYDCAVVLNTNETKAAAALLERFPKETFNRLFAEAFCPEWAEHPDLFAEALHEYLARTPARFDEAFQDRLLQGKDSLPDICAAWFSISGRYPFADVLDNCGVRVPSSEEDFISFAEERIASLETGRQARAIVRLARYLPLGLGHSPIEQARTLADAIVDPIERLATYEIILAAMPNGPAQTTLADSAIELTSHQRPGRPRVYSRLRLVALVSAERLPKLRADLLGEFEQVANLSDRAAIIRQARRWARSETQHDILRMATLALPDDRLRRWAEDRLSTDLPVALNQVAVADSNDHEVTLAWVLAGLAGRGGDLLSAFAQQQNSDPWSMLPSSETVAIDQLLLLGEKVGLPLTGIAASAVDWMNANGRNDLLKLLLPLLERPSREAWPSVYRWLDDLNPLVAQHAGLIIAENGRQITPRTFPNLLALLEGGLDRSRLRAALTLHGRVVTFNNEERTLLASRLGGETLDLIGRAIFARRPDRIAPALLTPSIPAGRQRSSEKVLSWMGHQIVFDDPQLTRDHLAQIDTDPAAGAVLGLLEACSSTVLAVLADSLLGEQSPLAQRVILKVLAQLTKSNSTSIKYRMCPEDEDWDNLNSMIPRWIAGLSPQVHREPILLADADGLVTAFIEATKQVSGVSAIGGVEVIVRGCRSAYAPLGDTELTAVQDRGMEFLRILGTRRYYYPRDDSKAAHAAAERLGEDPAAVPQVLQWLAVLLREDLNDPSFANVRQALLETVAAFAEQHPSTVAAQSIELNLLPLFCRVVTFSSHFRSRADAVLLIGALRRLTDEAAIALLSAMRDVFDVQNAALVAVDRFRYVDQAALDLMLAEVDPCNDSSTAIYGAARLLAGLATSECLTAAQRQTVVRRLATVLQSPDVCRRGVYLMTGSGGKNEKGLRVRQEARLGEVLYEALLRVAGGTLQLRSPIKPR